MTAKEFLIRELHNLYGKYKSKGIGIRYEHRIETSTHIVEVSPISFYCDNMTYIQDEERIEEIFENQFDDNIIFITKDSLVKIKNPILVLESKITNEEEEFRSELATLLNKYSKENGSNTPDFVLADYLISCLEAYNQTVNDRDGWYQEQNELQFIEISHSDKEETTNSMDKLVLDGIDRKLKLKKVGDTYSLWSEKLYKAWVDISKDEELLNQIVNKEKRVYKIEVGGLSDEETEDYIREIAKKMKVDDSKVIKSIPRFVSENFKEIKKEHKPTPPLPPPMPEPRLYRGDGSPIKPKK